MKIIQICLLLMVSSYLFALDINRENIQLDDFEISYYVDSNHSVEPHAINQIDFKLLAPNKRYLGDDNLSIFYKLELSNSGERDKSIFIHYDHIHLMSSISFFEFEKGALIATQSFDLNAKDIEKRVYGNSIVYRINIKKYSSKWLYIKAFYPTHHYVNINLYDQKNAFMAFNEVSLVYVIIVSAMFILGLYNLILFFYSPYKEYLYYGLFLFSGALSVLYLYGGLSHFFHIYGDDLFKFHVSLCFVQIFIVLFTKAFFDIQHKVINAFLNSSIVLLLAMSFYLVFIDYKLVIAYANRLHQYTFIIVYLTGVYFFIQKHPLAKYFLIANVFFFIFGSLSSAFFGGHLPYNFVTYHAAALSVLFEAIAYSVLLSYRIRLLNANNIKNEKKILEKSKKEEMGNLISIIAHQWKKPLSIISSQVLFYQLKQHQKESIQPHEYDKSFATIEKQIEYASDTIDKFRHFFNSNLQPKRIELSKTLNIAINLMQTTLREQDIQLESRIESVGSIVSYDNDILQVLLILIQNASEQFDRQEKKRILLSIYEDSEHLYIEVADNAGGVPKEIMPKIFEEYFSTKSSQEGTGLGLHLSKVLIEERCGGELRVKNVSNGATFTITLPKS